MKNSFVVSVDFSFKGETLSPAVVVDLDPYMERGGTIPPLHDLIAAANGIDAYSYQYEMLLGEELQFSAVQGFAAEFIAAGAFDAEGFMARWQESRIENIVATIARRELDVADLAAAPALHRALLAAYGAGQASVSRADE